MEDENEEGKEEGEVAVVGDARSCSAASHAQYLRSCRMQASSTRSSGASPRHPCAAQPPGAAATSGVGPQ